jgi:hypothetical protein
MKRLTFSLLILAMILPAMVLSGCSTGNDSTDDNLEDNPFVLKGKVYTVAVGPTGSYEYEPSTDSGVLEVYVDGRVFATGELTNGEFSITLDEEPIEGLRESDQFKKFHFLWGWDDTIIPEFKFTKMALYNPEIEKNLIKRDLFYSRDSRPWFVETYVDYLFVDRDITVALDEKISTSIDSAGLNRSDIFNKSVLSLKKGWNALTTKWEETGSTGEYSHTVSVSVEDAAHYWVIPE